MVTEKEIFKGVGKYIKDNIKWCAAIPDRDKSYYCYNPVWDIID